jgi:hypothetical protein
MTMGADDALPSSPAIGLTLQSDRVTHAMSDE